MEETQHQFSLFAPFNLNGKPFANIGEGTRCLQLQPIIMPFDNPLKNGTSNVQFVFAILLFCGRILMTRASSNLLSLVGCSSPSFIYARAPIISSPIKIPFQNECRRCNSFRTPSGGGDLFAENAVEGILPEMSREAESRKKGSDACHSQQNWLPRRYPIEYMGKKRSFSSFWNKISP